MKNTPKRTRHESNNGLAKACAVTALLTQIAPSSPGQEAAATLPQDGSCPLEGIMNPGPFRIRPYGWLNAYYDNNFLLVNDQEQDDFIWTLTPGVAIGAGDYMERKESYMLLDYSANVFLFTDNSDYNGHNQNVNFGTQWRGSKLTLNLSQLYQGSFGGLIGATNRADREFAGKTINQQVFPTFLGAHYQFSDKTSLDVDGGQLVRDFDEDDGDSSLNSYNQWNVNPWFNYHATEKVTAGIGANLGWRDIQGGENQSYQQALVRMQYQVAAKVSAFGSAGCQWDQYQGGYDDGPFFVFSAGLDYKPLEGTKLSLEAHRRQFPSITEEQQNYLITGIQASVRQRLWQKWSASLIGGYDYTEYETRVSGPSPDRNDNFFYVGPSLDYSITPKWDASVYYIFRKNDSNESISDYDDHQIGVYTAYRF